MVVLLPCFLLDILGPMQEFMFAKKPGCKCSALESTGLRGARTYSKGLTSVLLLDLVDPVTN